LIIIFLLYLLERSTSKNKTRLEAKLKEKGITIRIKDQIDLRSYIAMDTENKYVIYLSTSINQLNIYEVANLESIEVKKDGETVYKKSISSALGRAVVGGLVFGGIGAVAGASTAASYAQENIKAFDLIIIDKKGSNWKIPFVDSSTLKRNIPIQISKAEKWVRIITNYIN